MAKKVDRTSGLSFRPVYQNQLFRILLDLAGIPPPATVLERPSYRDRIPAPAQQSRHDLPSDRPEHSNQGSAIGRMPSKSL